jgi:hypothetical protein
MMYDEYDDFSYNDDLYEDTTVFDDDFSYRDEDDTYIDEDSCDYDDEEFVEDERWDEHCDSDYDF